MLVPQRSFQPWPCNCSGVGLLLLQAPRGAGCAFCKPDLRSSPSSLMAEAGPSGAPAEQGAGGSGLREPRELKAQEGGWKRLHHRADVGVEA